MYTLRRHRRQLLFPPGLLALGFLLLLGCAVVSRNAERLKPRYALPLFMFRTTPDPLLSLGHPELYMPLSQLEQFRPWQTVLVTGNIWQDYFQLQQAQAITQQLHQDSNHNRGLRIRFGAQASYASLIRTLDYLYSADVNKYWLDVHHEPTTLYTFTTYHPQALVECYGSIMGDASTVETKLLSCTEIGAIPFKSSSQEAMSFRAKVVEYILSLPITATWAPLLHPAWRSSLLLLLLLALVSGRRQWQQRQQWQRA